MAIDQVAPEAPHHDRRTYRRTLEQRSDFTGEHHALGRRHVVQRLDPEPISTGNQSLTRRVVQDERPHAVEPSHAVGAPGIVCREDDFRIGPAMEAVAARRQFVAQLAVVVDLAVEREPAAGRSAHRLATGLGEIENLEAAMSEA